MSFAFDRVLGPLATQQQVFEETAKPLVQHVLQGYNATVFAYGATGCGKTHTICGSRQDPGLITRTMEHLFASIRGLDDRVELAVSFLEVYNETIRDLLSPQSGLDLREDEHGVTVSGLSMHVPESIEQVTQWLIKGNNNRSKASTHANAVSSRSHAVLQIHVKRKRTTQEHDQLLSATLCIIDLAGSEVVNLI